MCSKTPVFLKTQIVFSNYVHNHDTRGSRNGQLVLPRPKFNSLRRSCIYRSLSLWNDLPRNLCCIDSKPTFKKHLKLYLLQWGLACSLTCIFLAISICFYLYKCGLNVGFNNNIVLFCFFCLFLWLYGYVYEYLLCICVFLWTPGRIVGSLGTS